MVVTSGCKLAARWIFHAVGPTREDAARLRACYRKCLDGCVELGLRSIAFCCISCGIFGYPLPAATATALESVREWLEEHAADADGVAKQLRVVFCVFDESTEQVYHQLLPLFFPPAPQQPLPEQHAEPEPGQAGQQQEQQPAPLLGTAEKPGMLQALNIRRIGSNYAFYSNIKQINSSSPLRKHDADQMSLADVPTSFAEFLRVEESAFFKRDKWGRRLPGYPSQVITNVIFNGTIDQFFEAFGRRTAFCYSQLERRHDYIQWHFPGACFFHRRLYCARAGIVCKYHIYSCTRFDMLLF